MNRLFGSECDDSSPEEGVVWARFSRKYETWHFGPNDNKNVVYDGIDKNVLYRFADDENNSRRTTSYNRRLDCNYEPELFTEDIEEEWKEQRREDKEMYLVAQGSWDGDNLRYTSPVLVVEKPVFEELKDESNLAHSRSMEASPRHLHQNMRNR
jgi:hypothetical protein